MLTQKRSVKCVPVLETLLRELHCMYVSLLTSARCKRSYNVSTMHEYRKMKYDSEEK